uniref:Uncharacterized protein n=1 Tax=Anopheles atroparvus TaxID=41427 RepID=A0A182J2K5_ANOAO
MASSRDSSISANVADILIKKLRDKRAQARELRIPPPTPTREPTVRQSPEFNVDSLPSAETLDGVKRKLGIIDTCFPSYQPPPPVTPTPATDGDAEPVAEESYPETYRTLSSKEKLVLLFAENFRRQYREKFSHRKPLVLALPNECGVQKFVSTTLRPSVLLFPDLIGSWEEIAAFVADYIVYEPLDNQVNMVIRSSDPAPPTVPPLAALVCSCCRSALSLILFSRYLNCITCIAVTFGSLQASSHLRNFSPCSTASVELRMSATATEATVRSAVDEDGAGVWFESSDISLLMSSPVKLSAPPLWISSSSWLLLLLLCTLLPMAAGLTERSRTIAIGDGVMAGLLVESMFVGMHLHLHRLQSHPFATFLRPMVSTDGRGRRRRGRRRPTGIVVPRPSPVAVHHHPSAAVLPVLEVMVMVVVGKILRFRVALVLPLPLLLANVQIDRFAAAQRCVEMMMLMVLAQMVIQMVMVIVVERIRRRRRRRALGQLRVQDILVGGRQRCSGRGRTGATALLVVAATVVVVVLLTERVVVVVVQGRCQGRLLGLMLLLALLLFAVGARSTCSTTASSTRH